MILALYKFVCMYIYLSQYLYACMYVCMTGQQGMNALKAAQQSAMKSNTNSFISSGKSITRPRYNGNGGDDDENYFKKPNRLQFFSFCCKSYCFKIAKSKIICSCKHRRYLYMYVSQQSAVNVETGFHAQNLPLKLN